jgi:hypothetical protein
MSVKSFTVTVDVDEMASIYHVQGRIVRSVRKSFVTVRKFITDFSRTRGGFHYYETPTFHSLDALMSSGANVFDRIIEAFERDRRSGRPERLRKERAKRIALDAVRRAVTKASEAGATRHEIQTAFAVLDVAEVMGE